MVGTALGFCLSGGGGVAKMDDTWGGRGFSTTRWSLVVEACGDEGGVALGELCERYWYPLYWFVRRQGRSAADAEDLTQAFFAKLLEKGWLCRRHRVKRSPRSFRNWKSWSASGVVGWVWFTRRGRNRSTGWWR